MQDNNNNNGNGNNFDGDDDNDDDNRMEEEEEEAIDPAPKRRATQFPSFRLLTPRKRPRNSRRTQ